MIKLNKTQLQEFDKFMKHYISSSNAATGSLVDPNSNVTEKNVTTMMAEMIKPIMIQYNRHQRYDRIEKMFGKELAEQYLYDINHHTIYIHDESSGNVPYCASISLFPFLMEGSTCIGGNTEKPKHLSSFCGGFINLINQLATQFAGAIATPSFLICFDYFARKDYGEKYLTTHTKEIQQALQGVVYYLNEPSSGRNGQSVFWNLSMFDEHYLKGLYSDFCYPDENFSKVNFESVKELQKFFLEWFNMERTRKLLTFPVITSAMVYDKNKQIKDKDFKSFCAKNLSEGGGFFVYLSDNVDSLSSCCRLRNESKNEFSYTLGNVGEMTGSVHVITINMNRLIQDTHKEAMLIGHIQRNEIENLIKEKLQKLVSRIHKYHVATRSLYEELNEKNMYSAYKAKFIKMDRQFSTIGLNGLLEGCEFLGYDIHPGDFETSDYVVFCSDLLKTISEQNQLGREEYKILINTEFVPAENLGVKHANWDREDGYYVPRDCYNSYFYPVENEYLTIIEKAKLHGSEVTKYLDGGSAYHINLAEYLDQEQYEKLFDMMANIGVNYFCINVKVTCCEEKNCGYIDKRTLKKCSKCGSDNITHATRIIGYLRKITNFAEPRQLEEFRRFYH